MSHKYSNEEKQTIIDRYISVGESSASILADTGIPKSTFYNWLKTYQVKQNATKRKTVNIHNFQLLENKVVRLEGIIEILKNAGCMPQAPLKQRLYRRTTIRKIQCSYDLRSIGYPERNILQSCIATQKGQYMVCQTA